MSNIIFLGIVAMSWIGIVWAARRDQNKRR